MGILYHVVLRPTWNRDLPLVKLYSLFGHGLQAPFRMMCCGCILPEFCKPCLSLSPFQFAKLIGPYLSVSIYRKSRSRMQSIGRLQRNMNRNGEIPFLFSGSCFELLRAHSFNVVCMQHSIKFALFLFFVHFLVCDTHQRMEIHERP